MRLVTMLVLVLATLYGAATTDGATTADDAAAAACRPAIDFEATSDSVDGAYTAIQLTMVAAPTTIAGNRLARLSFKRARNGWVELPDGTRPQIPSTVALTGPQASFVFRRADLTAPFQLDYMASDACGDVERFLGSGQGASPGAPASATSTTSGPSEPGQPVPAPTSTATAIPQPPPPPSQTPEPAGDIAIGIYRPSLPDDLSSVVAYEQAAGRRMAIVHWYALWGGWKSAFSRTDLEAVAAHGSLPMITWEPWAGKARDPEWTLRDAILSGRSDAYIESWARGLAAYGRPVLLRFAHEMHAQTYPWAVGINGNTDEEYVAAWRYVHGFFERAGATNVQWVWNPNTLWGGSAPAADHLSRWQRLYPGDAYVDWTGLDIYNTGPSLDWGAPYWRSMDTVLAEPYTAITTLSPKPLLLGEVGSAEIGGDKGQWIADGLGPTVVTRFPRLHALIWYDINKEQNWAIRSSSGSYNAFVAAMQQPHFTTDVSSLLPLIATGGESPDSMANVTSR